MKICAIICIIMLSCVSCQFDLTTKDAELYAPKEWSPYVVVHPFGIYENFQQPHLLKLIKAGTLKGVRLWGLEQPGAQELANWLIDKKIEVLGLLHHSAYEFLAEPNFCEIFSDIISQNPRVTTWQIGSELSTFSLYEKKISPEEYVWILNELLTYIKQEEFLIKHPNPITLVAQAPAGSGPGADKLRRMIDAGLDELCMREKGLIVAIHFYSWNTTRLAEFKSQIARLPAHVKIWITECGANKWSNQKGYVAEMYPRLIDSIGAERIYWYVFSEDKKEGQEYCLVNPITWEYSPLMKKLIGQEE